MKNQTLMFFNPFKPQWFIVIVSLALFFSSCEKDQLTLDSLEVSGTTDEIPNVPFDWETIGAMPQPVGLPVITTPWMGGGVIEGYGQDIVDDYKKIDGWEMVYSTFSYTQYYENPYFVLYNRYRGILRVYLRITNIGAVPSDYLQYGIYELDADNYKYLNLDNQEVIDANQYIARVDKMQTSTLKGNAWYLLQYEIGYDTRPVISAYNPPTFWFYVNSVNVTELDINGTLKADIDGTLGGSSTSSVFDNIFKSLKTEGTSLGKKTMTAIGKAAIEKDSWNCIMNWSKIKEGALSAITGNLPGTITNVLSAVIGGSSSTTAQPISLNMDGTLSMSGTLEDTYTLPETPIRKYIPGTVTMASSENGNYWAVTDQVPLYNKRLGVFNVDGRPKINKVRTIETPEDGIYSYDDTYIISQLPIKFNPDVINTSSTGASIQNLTYEVIVKPYGDVTWGNLENYMVGIPKKEYTTLGMVYSAKASLCIMFNHWILFSTTNWPTYVRVSFRVVPNNGAPATTIMKTFKADVTEYIND